MLSEVPYRFAIPHSYSRGIFKVAWMRIFVVTATRFVPYEFSNRPHQRFCQTIQMGQMFVFDFLSSTENQYPKKCMGLWKIQCKFICRPSLEVQGSKNGWMDFSAKFSRAWKTEMQCCTCCSFPLFSSRLIPMIISLGYQVTLSNSTQSPNPLISSAGAREISQAYAVINICQSESLSKPIRYVRGPESVGEGEVPGVWCQTCQLKPTPPVCLHA